MTRPVFFLGRVLFYRINYENAVAAKRPSQYPLLAQSVCSIPVQKFLTGGPGEKVALDCAKLNGAGQDR